MPSSTEKYVWLSDLHVVAPGGRVLGYDPALRVSLAIRYIAQHHADATLCILSGDLTDDGKPDSYRNLKSILQDLPMPVLPLVGNHDDRAALIRELKPPISDGGSLVQYAVETRSGVVVCLDTQKPGFEGGYFADAQFKWLDDTLKSYADKPIYVFMHHPPLELGLTMQDKDRLENGEDVLARLERHSNIRHIFMGHVHRPVSGSVGGIPFTAMRSTIYQAPLPYPAWDWDTFSPAMEPPTMGIVLLNGDSTVVHFHQICDAHVGAPASSGGPQVAAL
jgi:3',5'-cyclic AMP phosphodiesterase CpdA